MENLTKQLARYVYNIDFNNMPLDRLSEQKAKKKRNFSEIGKSNQSPADDIRPSQSEASRKNQQNKDQESVKIVTVVNDHPEVNSPKTPRADTSKISNVTASGTHENSVQNDFMDRDTSSVAASSLDNSEGDAPIGDPTSHDIETVPDENDDKTGLDSSFLFYCVYLSILVV